MKQLKIKFGDKILYMNIDDWKAQRAFIKERERVFLEGCRRLFST